LRQEGIVDLVGVFDVVDGEAIARGFLREPDFGSIDERLVNAALLRRWRLP
jgi:hypothetical protein